MLPPEDGRVSHDSYFWHSFPSRFAWFSSDYMWSNNIFTEYRFHPIRPSMSFSLDYNFPHDVIFPIAMIGQLSRFSFHLLRPIFPHLCCLHAHLFKALRRDPLLGMSGRRILRRVRIIVVTEKIQNYRWQQAKGKYFRQSSNLCQSHLNSTSKYFSFSLSLYLYHL